MRRLFCAAVILITINCNYTYTQFRPFINDIISKISSNANAFFLAVNRPSYGVSTYMTPKRDVLIGTGLYFNEDLYEVPFDISYGLGNRVELSGGITGYMQSYNFLGEKVSGIGDSYLGIKYMFHESYNFEHVIQALIKIPTASKRQELGTGKTDFYFGIAQGFVADNFGYELSFECNLLARRDIPAQSRKIPVIIRALLDSIKQNYDYKYEPEFILSFTPDYSFSDKIYIYAGYSFTRNTRLDFNYSSLFGGIGVSTGKTFSFSLGGTYGLGEFSGWYGSIGINFLISGKR